MLFAFVALFLVPQQPPPASARLTDARTDRPIAGAEVTVSGTRGSARTDDEGRFHWPAPMSGPVIVLVILPDGRVAPPVVVNVATGAEATIAIDPTFAEAVTVSGVAAGIDVAGAAATGMVAGADIALRHPRGLTQVLELVPGISAISEGQALTPAIRGLARGRTLVLVDGLRVATERGAGVNASFLDPADLSRVDVARGPGSVAYGSDAFGGVISAETRLPDPGTPMRTSLRATVGAGVPTRDADLSWSAGYGAGGVLASVRYREFDDYRSPFGIVTHSHWQDSGARLAWTHRRGGNRWRAGWLSTWARDIARPRSDVPAIVATSPFENTHRLTVSFEGTDVAGASTLRMDGLFGAASERVEQDRMAVRNTPRRIDRADTGARDWQIRLTGDRLIGRGRYQLGLDVHGRSGVSATDTTFTLNAADQVTSTAVSHSLADARRTAAGIFTQADHPIGTRLRLSAGLRADTVRSRNHGDVTGDRTVDNGAFSGVASATWVAVPGFEVTGQIARGFRDPTLTDRFARGPVGRGILEGNPDLRPEHSVQVDLRAVFTASRVRVSVAGYDYHIRDLVERYTAGPDLFRLRNRGRSRLSGFEVEGHVSLLPELSVDASVEASRGEDALSGAPLDDIAPARLNVVLRHRRDRVASFLRVSWVGGRDLAGPNEVPTPGYALLDAGAEWRLLPGLQIRASIRNATDAEYYGSAGPRWVWAPGREAVVTLVVAR